MIEIVCDERERVCRRKGVFVYVREREGDSEVTVFVCASHR